MEFALFVLCVVFAGLIFFLYKKNTELKQQQNDLNERVKRLSIQLNDYEKRANSDFHKISKTTLENKELLYRIKLLEKYQPILDIDSHLQSMKSEFDREVELTKDAMLREKERVHQELLKEKQSNDATLEQEMRKIELIKERAIIEAESFKNEVLNKIKVTQNFLEEHTKNQILIAEQDAKAVLHEYFDLANKKRELSSLVKALENKLNGYSDEYLIPNSSLLDDLIDGYDFLDAAQQLKKIRMEIKSAIQQSVVAECDYVEENRRTTAIAFITNAFNSKADVHVSRLKHDNVGKLIEALKGDYLLLNNYGEAFRSARINPSYLALRISELNWAAMVLEFKEREREEQRAIREQIREEEKAQREYERAMKEAEKEESLLKKAYEKAKKEFDMASDDQKSKYDSKMQELMHKLQEAEEKNQRALSMAQQTRAGHVYVISNIGSFGDDVLKLGMTRRLEPMDRIRELGDASVPFSFDVHAMIYSDDAPTLEKELHHYFNHQRVNKVNYKKEFFRVGLTEVKNYLDTKGIQAKFTLKAEALQYRESLNIELMPDELQRKFEDSMEDRELAQKEYELIEDEG